MTLTALPRVECKFLLRITGTPWEIIAGKLSAAGYTWGYCSAVTKHGWRWVVDAYRGDGRRFIVESDDLLSAFLELEATLL